MDRALITVVETRLYQSRAEKLLSDEERQHIIGTLAENPLAGDLIVGGNGIRKVRFAQGNKGKSGGVRVIYYYHSRNIPLFLMTLFAKGQKVNLSKTEIASLAKIAELIAEGELR